ncbi:MAG TPA: hypothetical protein VFR42_13860, partial [Candidatus Acidoferrum sp.]|nr:hypothetical protein [Candidatus Acidoferrum sp.]
MWEEFPGSPPSAKPPDDRLDSWKEIASYLNRDVTTVQRWEKREAMPVHRHLHDRMGSVYASRSELDAWVVSRNPPAAPENGTYPVSPHPRELARSELLRSLTNRTFLLLTAAALVLLLGASLWLQKTEYFWRNPL